MKTHASPHLIAALACLLCACQAAPTARLPLEREEFEIEEADVPAAALAALRELAGGRPFEEFEREDRGAFFAYEAEWMENGLEAEATVLADGSVLETGRELADSADLPPGVRARVEALRRLGYEVEVERLEFTLYDVDAVRAGATDDEGDGGLELLLLPDGADAKTGRVD